NGLAPIWHTVSHPDNAGDAVIPAQLSQAKGKGERVARQPAAAFARWQAAQIRAGVAGISIAAPAPPGIASVIAFMMVAIAAVVLPSPAPLTRSGLVVAGTGWSASRSGGMSAARGIA